MAKFVTALCILLVAYGAQGLTFPAVTDKLTNILTSYFSDAQTQVGTIREGITSATTVVDSYEDQVTSTVQNAITETAAKYTSDTIVCIESNLTKILSDSNAIVGGIQDSIKVFNDFGTGAVACMSNGQSSIASCITSIWTLVVGETASNWTKLLADAAILFTDVSNPQTSIDSRGLTAASDILASEAQEFYSKIEKCMANLNSTTS